MTNENYFFVNKAILNDIVWDFHRTPNGTAAMFLYLATQFEDGKSKFTVDLKDLNGLVGKPSPNKLFRRSFMWLINNGYFDSVKYPNSTVYDIWLTDKTKSLVKLHREDCHE